MTTKTLRVGFLGAGEQTWESLIPAFRQLAARRGGVEVVGVADLDFARAQLVADDHGVPAAFRSQDEMLDSGEVNAVVVAVPHRHHAAEGLRALRAGCHLFLEKPMAASASEARELLEEARDRNLALMVDYQYPRALRGVMAALEGGLIGSRYEVRGAFQFTDGTPDRKVYWDTPASGGVRLDYLGHLLSVTFAALGETVTPLAVSAQGWSHGGRLLKGAEFRTVSKVSTTLRLTGNARAELRVDWAALERLLGIEVEGERGLVKIPMMAAELQPLVFLPTLYRRHSGGLPKMEQLRAYPPTPTEASFALQAEAFDDAIRYGKPLAFPFGPRLALTVQETLDAVGRSIELGGKEVSVPVRRS